MVYKLHQRSVADGLGCATVCNLGVLGKLFITTCKLRLAVAVNKVVMKKAR